MEASLRSQKSYDAQSRSVDAVISMGSPVKRFYGTEKLRISPEAVDLSRMQQSGIPLLDSHNRVGIENHLGRISRTWFAGNALWGRLVFNDTERGRVSEGMVARGEIAGISAGYRVDDWEITDADGKVLDPEKTRINFDDDLTFTATRWHLYEASLVSVPADAASSIRSLGTRAGTTDDIRARMLARQRMYARMPPPFSPEREAKLDRLEALERMLDRQRGSERDYDIEAERRAHKGYIT